VQRVISGEQFMTVYKPIQPLVDAAAPIAVALAQGKPVPSGLVNAQENNGMKSVRTVKLPVIPVTKDNVKDTILKDGYWNASQICTAAYKSACTAAGIA
jgi:D-xylose transport system substrate-binding protein